MMPVLSCLVLANHGVTIEVNSISNALQYRHIYSSVKWLRPQE